MKIISTITVVADLRIARAKVARQSEQLRLLLAAPGRIDVQWAACKQKPSDVNHILIVKFS